MTQTPSLQASADQRAALTEWQYLTLVSVASGLSVSAKDVAREMATDSTLQRAAAMPSQIAQVHRTLGWLTERGLITRVKRSRPLQRRIVTVYALTDLGRQRLAQEAQQRRLQAILGETALRRNLSARKT